MEIKEKPILFSAPMVRAILDGRKTQTRRQFSDSTIKGFGYAVQLGEVTDFINSYVGEYDMDYIVSFCPHGQIGDQLWVKETFFAYGRWETRYSEKKGRDEWHFIDMTAECGRAYQYAADNPDLPLAKGRGALPGWHKRPAIFMPGAASRTSLEVVIVRVERLNDISEEDAKAEGVDPAECCLAHYHGFSNLWESLNGAGSWQSNPWVWVIEFRKI